jgi:hypothetical protein
MQSCENGQWGTCLGDPGYQTYCPDADLDGYCVLGSCNVSACPNDPLVTQQKLKLQGGCQLKTDCDDARSSTHPGATELCNDNIDSDCDGNVSNGYPIGAGCTVGDHGVCRRKGTLVCNGAGTGTQCSVSAGSPTDSFPSSPSTDPAIDTSNQSVDYFPRWDWNCDGQNQTLFALNHNATMRGEVCSGNFEAACNLLSQGSCGQFYTYCETTGGFFNTDAQSCGKTIIAVLCLWGINVDNQCGAAGNTTASQDCK